MAAKWGNPDTKSFERQFLRQARFDETVVHVHRHIWPMVERILIGLEGQGIDVSRAADVDDPLKLGFQLPDADPEVVNALVAEAKFEYADGVVRFVGTADDAVAIATAIGAEVEEELPDPPVIDEDQPRSGGTPPFSTELTDGQTALFIQYLTGATPTGVVDEETVARLTEWQRRMGIPETGELDERTWSYILPRRITWMRPGATGAQVKVIQAAFKAKGFYEPPVISGVWGIHLSQALRKFQHDYRLHSRLRIGNPEWEALFGPRS